MKYLIWTLAIALIVMGFAWNYASNSSRYEHAKYLSVAYKGGVKNYNFSIIAGELEFDSPSLASLRSVTPRNYSNRFPRDEMIPVFEGQLKRLAEMRTEYGAENVVVKFYARRDLGILDAPWSNYLEVNEFGLFCENESSAYKTAKCFFESHGENDEQLNSANKIKALQWMNKAYYESKSSDEKALILDEYMIMVSVPIETYELDANYDNISPAVRKFQDASIMSTEIVKLLAKKVEEKWPKDVCMRHSFYWLFWRDQSTTTVLRARCNEQLARTDLAKTSS